MLKFGRRGAVSAPCPAGRGAAVPAGRARPGPAHAPGAGLAACGFVRRGWRSTQGHELKMKCQPQL